MVRLFFGLGAAFAFIGVVLGAFGAHALRNKLEPRMLEVFETGVRYQMYHALALIATAWAASQWPGSTVTTAGWFFVGGIVIFSGSLYALTLSDVRTFGAITPLGGVGLLAGWLCLLWTVIKA